MSTLSATRYAMIEGFEQAMAEQGIVPDAAQRLAAERLQVFYDDLIAFKTARRDRLRKLLVHPKLPRGVWLWGGVGRGKSFLLDCFFKTVPYKRKRRVHFHAFLREIHLRLNSLAEETDPLIKVSAEIAKQTRFMCFDEFHLSDIADAMILGRLMQGLFDAGVVFCITSNYPPSGLYPNGLHRDRLLPTIALLEEKLDIVRIDAGIDYRLKAIEQANTYYVSLAPIEIKHTLSTLFTHIAQGQGHTTSLSILERDIPVICRAPGVVWFDFAVLCGDQRSQNDYLEIAHHFHTIFLSGVPQMSSDMASEARRLTWLIDVLYDCRVKLIMAAACPAEQLYCVGPQAHEFQRTVSRLIEMRSHAYLSAPHHTAATQIAL